MAKVRILKKQGKAYLELPSETLNCDELELFLLKEGYYLLSIPLGKKDELSEAEKELLRKLLSIRFEKRTPPYVAKVLSDAEKEMLKSLEQRKHVNVFRGQKYKQGVYNINDRTYPLLKEIAVKKVASDPISQLKAQGFLIIKDKRAAFELSKKLNQEMKDGRVAGVKGFDGNFYLVTREYLAAAKATIASMLTEEMDVGLIASASKLDQDGCTAVLHLMAENGDIIEKKKGIFAPI
ncbi:hypothetical protein KKB44_02635 [Candidatus Micrarchaeota archaeon]|nr:hypothetical protein [Candidatus Micrarchaeota archaeon]